MSTRPPLVLAGLATLLLTFGSGCGSFAFESRAVAASLPYQACPAPIQGDGMRIHLPAGVYRCDIVVIGNGNRVVGSSARRTIIEGNVVVRGNGNVLKRMRVLGGTQVAGYGNRVNSRKYRGRRVARAHRHNQARWVYR